MAIAFDTSTAGSDTVGGSSLSVSHNVTGSNPCLMVGIQTYGDNSGTDYLTSATYNSVAMTQVAKVQTGQTGSPIFQQGWVYLYRIVGITGTHNISVTFSIDPGQIFVEGSSYTGVSQTAPINVSNTGHATTGSPLSVSVTTTVNNTWLVGTANSYQDMGSGYYSATIRQQQGPGGNRHIIGDSNGSVGVAGSYSQTLTLGGNWYPGFVVAALTPYVAPPNSNFLTFF